MVFVVLVVVVVVVADLIDVIVSLKVLKIKFLQSSILINAVIFIVINLGRREPNHGPNPLIFVPKPPILAPQPWPPI